MKESKEVADNNSNSPNGGIHSPQQDGNDNQTTSIKLINLENDTNSDDSQLKMGQESDEPDRAEIISQDVEHMKSEENVTSPVLKYHYKDDQWSPLNVQGKKQYDCDFLRSLQNDPNSKNKPVIENLDILDNILQRDIGVIQNMSRQHDLLPMFAKGSAQRGGPISKRGSQQGKPSPRATKGGSTQGSKSNVIHMSLSLRDDIKLNETENAWKPVHLKKSDNISEEERRTEQLYKTFRGILNKLTPEKFDKLVGDIKNLKIDTIDRLKGIINLVYDKAVDEPSYSIFYASMCRELIEGESLESATKPADDATKPTDDATKPAEDATKPAEDTTKPTDGATEPAEGAKPTTKSNETFRYLIISRCQAEFEKEKKFENSQERAAKRKEIAECNDPEKKKELLLEMEEEERKVRMKSVGNCKFIGELFRQGMLGSKVMESCFHALLSNMQEETLECLCKLLTTTGRILENEKKVSLTYYFTAISKIITKKDNRISSRVRFMLQDVVDLRNNDWVPRRMEEKAKTLDQIEQEVEEEHKHIERMNATPKGSARKDDRGGRGRNKGGRGGHGNDDGWNTAQPRPRQTIDSMKLQKLKPTNIIETKLGPSGFSWSKGSSAKSAASRSMGSPIAMSPVSMPFTGFNKFSPLEAAEAEIASHSPTRPQKDVQYSKGASIERSTFQRGNKNINRQDSKNSTLPVSHSQPQDTKDSDREMTTVHTKTVSQPPTVAVEPLTEQEIDKINIRVKDSVEEYFMEISKYVHVITEFQEVYKAHHMPAVLTQILNVALEKPQIKCHMLTRDLIFHMVKSNLITLDMYLDCVTENILNIASDLLIDYPKLYHYLAIWLVPHIRYQNLSLKTLLGCSKKAIEELQGKRLLENLLKQLVSEAGQPFVKKLWVQDKQVLTDWMPAEMASSFLKDNDLEFLINDDEPVVQIVTETPAAKCPLTADETQKIIVNFLQKNQDQDYITNWIQNNIGESVTEGWFLRALMKAVCEDALFPPGESIERVPRFSPMSDKRICNHVLLLVRYVENKEDRELECLFAIQQLLDDYEHPSGVALQLFDCFHRYEVISSEAFLAWEEDKNTHEQKGKGVLIKSLHSFFVILKEQDNESGEDD